MLAPMKQLFFATVLGMMLSSCGSDPVARPFLAQPLDSKPTPVAVKPSDPPKKAFAGKVTFAGLSNQELSRFRIIPENGTTLTIPDTRSYDQVDGFWWQGSGKGEWFKIPDHSEAWVGEAPEKHDGTAHRDHLKIYYRKSLLGGLARAIGGGLEHPDWVSDQGPTKSPVPSPW